MKNPKTLSVKKEVFHLKKNETLFDFRMKQLRRILRDTRRRRGWTQKEIAEDIGIPYQDYQKYEYGYQNPKKERYYQLCHALCLPVDNSIYEFEY